MAELGEIRASASAYARRAGLHLPDTDYAQVAAPASMHRAVGQAYGRMAAFDEGALPAYHAMRDETLRQFDHMTAPRSKGGLGIDVEVTKHDPYGSKGPDSIYREFRDDVMHRNRMQVLSTAETGGHPVFSDEENDKFRAVHDVYGHLGAGRGIDRHGEEAAYQKHSRMFSPLARQAMATETRGQNSAFVLHGDFQEQKVGILPSHLQSLQFRAPAHEMTEALRVAHANNRKQGVY